MLKRSLALLLLGLIGVLPSCGSGKRERSRRSERCCPCPADAGIGGRSADGALAHLAPDGGISSRRAQPFSLLGGIKGFQSVRRCVAITAAALPPELTREADGANLAQRICETRRALAEKNVGLCDEIDDQHWPRACRRLWAGLYGQPVSCPFLYPRYRGREPLCLAVAARDPALCRAVASAAARQRCLAILGPASLCLRLHTRAEVASCRRDRRRWRAVLRPGKPSLSASFKPRSRLILKSGGRTVKGEIAGVERGLVLPDPAVRNGRFLIGSLTQSPEAGPAGRQLRLAIDVPVPDRIPAKLVVGIARTSARVCGLWQGRPLRPAMATGELALRSYSARRGWRVAGELTITLRQGERTAELTGSFDTFVRDTVPGGLLPSCQARLASLGISDRPPATGPSMGTDPPPESGRPCYFVAHWQGPRQVGYRTYGVRPRDACARLGLRDGDVLTRIGNRPARRWQDVVTFYEKLRAGGLGRVTVLRHGRTVRLSATMR